MPSFVCDNTWDYPCPLPTSFRDAALAVLDVDPDERHDGHEREGHAADVAQPVARPQRQPGQDQHRREGEAVEQLEQKKESSK